MAVGAADPAQLIEAKEQESVATRTIALIDYDSKPSLLSSLVAPPRSNRRLPGVGSSR